MKRLTPTPMERIDREKEIPFFYRGRMLKGLAGDTVATALFANGVRIFSRSLKYHRPRGLCNLEGHSSHCLMSVNGEPNVRACATPVEPGMDIKPQNVIGSPEWDILSVLQGFHRFMPAGFYYRMFHRPAWIWPAAQKVLRWSAGVGRIDPGMPEGVYDNKYLHCEVCVIGGGLAGMTAALQAARAGVRVLLLERSGHLGGSLDYRRNALPSRVPAYLYGRQKAAEVLASENIRVLPSTVSTGIYQSNHVTAVQRGVPEDPFRLRYFEIRAASVVVATGAVERPLLFENNDAPGVMEGRCAQQLVHRYALRPGTRAVLSGCHDGMLEVAGDLAEAGVAVMAVADARLEGMDSAYVARLEGLAIPLLAGYVAAGASQRRSIKGVELLSIVGRKPLRLPCDLLVASGGEVPLSQLLHVAGAPMTYDRRTARFIPELPPKGIHGAGRVTGLDSEEAIEAQGNVAGLSALGDVGVDVGSALTTAKEALASLPRPKGGWRGELGSAKGAWCFVSFDEDVTVGQVEEALTDGFDGPELIKRYTAAGTGPSQGTLSGQNLAMVVAAKKGLDPGDVLPTTVRPPVEPVSLGVLGGRCRHPVKRTPLHAEQKALGAVFRLAGEWERAAHFGDSRAWDEVLNVRNNVGFIDISTLGKFRVHGPDALKLLQRVYVGDMGKVREGRLTYSMMCNEEGVVIDDGVITSLGREDYFFTTSTIRAPHTCEWLQFHSRREDWQAYAVNLTDALAAINLAGPRAREVLSRLTEDDVSNETLPFMGFRRITLCGDMEAFIARVGFVGEICYEIHVPASSGPALHRAILEAGIPFGIQPFGLEAQSILRLEKGHVIIVVDTDNHTTLHEIGAARIWAREKKDAGTVGAPALRFAEGQKHREKLVGFVVEETGKVPPDGSIVVSGEIVTGRVCTCRYSPTLKQTIGMALVAPEFGAIGGTLEIYTDGKLLGKRLPKISTLKARVVSMPFFDPQGERLRQ